jgi:hypothetical protein
VSWGLEKTRAQGLKVCHRGTDFCPCSDAHRIFLKVVFQHGTHAIDWSVESVFFVSGTTVYFCDLQHFMLCSHRVSQWSTIGLTAADQGLRCLPRVRARALETTLQALHNNDRM